MSSVAIQPVPAQTQSLASPSNRQYPTTHDAQAAYYNQQISNQSPQDNNRRQSRRSSNRNGATSSSQPTTSYSTIAPTLPVNTRDAQSITSSTSPAYYADTAQSNIIPMKAAGPVAPPRSSSYTDRASSHRTDIQVSMDKRIEDAERHERMDYERREGGRHTNGTSGSTTIPIRPATHGSRGSPSSESHSRVTREPSAVLDRVMVSKPEEDLVREQERIAESAQSTAYNSAYQENAIHEASARVARSRQDHSSSNKEKNTKFGDYFLGATVGEGEFGKVKMGWKQEGGVQVAIKLLRRDNIGSNPVKLAKIYREIAILREISHPNIVRLHEMVQTEKHIGIILEYASGGELFDYILNNRYLKDNTAKRLFAQLISGVGYLHKKGIVHRDLKLENLLLDRNRNMIISDFGFANTFDPSDELSEEIEYNLSNREYVAEAGLDKILPKGFRRGDLMQTSCGSPCYAAPELVVSESLYTGRKVDVWSCGVILYAMLAGYLPFDDDPANPEGDNINLLYKYITSTPLTFPEYVTPHARDLLRRLLVPDPRKRADLFEVARHSWLSEYAHVVEFITSTTTNAETAAQNVHRATNRAETSMLGRSASVREPSKQQYSGQGDLTRKHGNVDHEKTQEDYAKAAKDTKRRTVQVEYVAPRSETVRGHEAPPVASGAKTRARPESQGPVEVPTSSHGVPRKAIPTDRQQHEIRDGHYNGDSRVNYDSSGTVPPPSRPSREPPRSVSDNAFGNMVSRPMTGSSLTSATSGRASMGLQNRGTSYGQPAAPRVYADQAHGQMAQSERSNLAESLRDDEALPSEVGSPSISSVPAKFDQITGFSQTTGPQASQPQPRPITSRQSTAHKRNSTVGSFSERFFGRRGSLFGGSRSDKSGSEKPSREKPSKKYPPVSMQTNTSSTGLGRASMERSSRRSMSFGFGKKRSNSILESETGDNKPRRNSFLPASFSLRSIGIGGNNNSYESQSGYESQDLDAGQLGDGRRAGDSENQAGYNNVSRNHQQTIQERRAPPQAHERYSQQQPAQPEISSVSTSSNPAGAQRRGAQQPQSRQSRQRPVSYHPESYGMAPAQTPLHTSSQQQSLYPAGFNEGDDDVMQGYRQPVSQQNTRKPAEDSLHAPSASGGKSSRGVLQKPNRRFEDTQERHDYSRPQNSGSTSAARRVMDFFRKRGRDRSDRSD